MNAPTGPVRVIRPAPNSTRMSGIDQLNRQITHETMKAPPPCSATMRKKRQMFPMPTTIPSIISIISHREEKLSGFMLMPQLHHQLLFSCFGPSTANHAIEEVNHQSDHQPGDKAYPRRFRKGHHQIATRQH